MYKWDVDRLLDIYHCLKSKSQAFGSSTKHKSLILCLPSLITHCVLHLSFLYLLPFFPPCCVTFSACRFKPMYICNKISNIITKFPIYDQFHPDLISIWNLAMQNVPSVEVSPDTYHSHDRSDIFKLECNDMSMVEGLAYLILISTSIISTLFTVLVHLI